MVTIFSQGHVLGPLKPCITKFSVVSFYQWPVNNATCLLFNQLYCIEIDNISAILKSNYNLINNLNHYGLDLFFNCCQYINKVTYATKGILHK